MFAITHKKIFYGISIVLLVTSLVFVAIFGLKPSIDFTGGSLIEISYPENVPEQTMITETLIALGHENPVVRHSDESGYFIKVKSVTDDERQRIEEALSFAGEYPVVENRFNTVGPTLGHELATKSIMALILVVIAIVFYVAYVFRHVSKPVSSWKYGLSAIIALVHDVLIALGTFAILGYVFGTEVDTLFVTALLVILGYSVNDSIVVLDRVRENLKEAPSKKRTKEFDEIVGRSLKETLSRSINTSITTLLALVALFLFGGDTTKDFALALIVGVIAGGYSSIFIAAPLLTTFLKMQKVVPEEDKK